MNISIFRLKRQIAFCLAIALFAPLDAIAAMPSGPQSAAATEARLDNAAQSTSYPDSPGAMREQAAGQQQTDTSQSPPANQQNSTAPVGTAAAPYVKPEGVPASRPAGAVIAPAKQKRVHSFALRIGILVGAGIAIGTVTALSLSNSGRPH